MSKFGGKILFLNAPPGAGKDSVADTLNFLVGAERMEFKQPLYDIAMAVTGLPEGRFFELYNDRKLKESPLKEFFGLTPRALMIKISEEWCKPSFGKNFFGLNAANRMHEYEFYNKGFVFSDCGFEEEIFPIADKFGYNNCTVVQFTGQGVEDFPETDSRDWIYPEGIRVVKLPFKNNSSLTLFVDDMLEYLYSREEA